ncbi:DMT family transporter [Sphingomonas sp. NY01]|uniref:DMT family transporter n=1 Tax=Sphingomonas sp. NY01 TaxID=2968057 RepID=UPI00315D0918
MHASAPPRKTAPAQTPLPDASPAAFAAVILANVALAFGPWFVRLADTGPVAAAFWRITLAAPVLVAAAFVAGGGGVRGRQPPWGLLGVLLLSGIAFAGDLGTWHLGIRQTTLANATLFGNSATLIFPIYGFLVARAWPTRMQAFALLLAALGGGLLMGRSYQADPRHLIGDLLCLAAGVLYAVYFILMARVRTRVAPVPALAMSTLASIVPLLLYALMLGERIWPDHWGALIAMALVSQVVGQGLMIYALGKLSPLVIGIALLVQPIVAGAIGWIIYGERLGGPDLLGVALVAAALVLVRRKGRSEA